MEDQTGATATIHDIDPDTYADIRSATVPGLGYGYQTVQANPVNGDVYLAGYTEYEAAPFYTYPLVIWSLDSEPTGGSFVQLFVQV
jgi:hypothetical protein